MIYAFEGMSLDTDRRELFRGSERISVEPSVFDLIEYLVLNRDHVVTRDDLIENIWHGRIVSESTLTSRTTAARHALGDRGDEQQLIRTVPRKGLRFVARVTIQHERGSDDASVPTPVKPAIAVLPFLNMSGDPEQEYFSDGISEDLIMALARLRWFFVIARNSSFAYKGQSVDVRQIGEALDVNYLLEGSVRKSGDRIRIACQLLDAATGNHIWAERYDRELTDIFALQDEITANVVAAIEPELVAAEGRRAQRRVAAQLQAWDLVARELPHFWRFSPDASACAIAGLRRTHQAFPDYAPAMSLLSFALLFSTYAGWESGSREEALDLARAAIEIDRRDPWAHMAVGFAALTDRDTDEALRSFGTALSLNPNFAPAVGFSGFAMALDGRSDEALEWLDRATRMNPRDPFSNIYLAPKGAALYTARHYDEAVTWAREAVRMRPGYLGGHRLLCAALAQTGRLDEAREALKELLSLRPDADLAWVRASVPYTERTMEHFIEGLRRAGLPETASNPD
ncbi:tetratricopeptide repeat protein [Defluviimonas sp. WL0002]|uniref:Tetratricopeptide repeat protein n=1 Tax=Albidovulum marisflavi TaxID=2984159 RepID=A0ABT2ZGS5_9RHOB|nr:tetratricopeptide repeat protein [Defluviimonas sp. WL0002]MCV2870327.1 tetratricopeptide repeat protein [Defluviimonas sp. WL0002]